MCGIVGIFSKKAQKLSKNLYQANNQMKNRGPDDEGFCFFQQDKVGICYGKDTPLLSFFDNQVYYPNTDVKSTFDNFYHVGLAHRRLSILDVSSHGHQPMCDSSERYWVVFNGEVYNYKEIRNELIQEGQGFVSNTDTEVILKAFIRWGEKCLSKFNGMFAFVIFDRYENRAFIARDRIGMKPLYFSKTDEFFIFASDIKTILASGLVKAEVNGQGLYQNFAFGMTPRPNTSFKNIFSVKQGSYFWLNGNTLDVSEEVGYWDVPTNKQDFGLTEQDSKELLESELLKSIQYQLNSDVEVGTFMSGGIDSTTIAAMASRLHPGIKAFTLGFDKSIAEFDETEEAISTAKKNEMQHIVSFLQADVVLNNIDHMVLGYEEPFYHLAANYAISEIVASNGVKVVFNGLGGDELFAGYGHYSLKQKLDKFKNLGWLLPIIPYGLNRKFDKLKKRLVQTPLIFIHSRIYNFLIYNSRNCLVLMEMQRMS